MEIIIFVLFVYIIFILWALSRLIKELEFYMSICDKQEGKIFELEEKLKELEGEDHV